MADASAPAALLVSREWDKAAVVWAYVHCYDGPGGDPTIAKNSNGKAYTPESFAAKGFTGLRSKDTVRAHWRRLGTAERPPSEYPVAVLRVDTRFFSVDASTRRAGRVCQRLR